MKKTPLYSVGTWDMDEQAFTPQEGLLRSINITRGELRQRLHALRTMGYTAHRRRCTDGTYDDNDLWVFVERTDDRPEAEILKSWKRWGKGRKHNEDSTVVFESVAHL